MPTTPSTILKIKDVFKKTPGAYKQLAGRAVAFIIDVYPDALANSQNKKILSVNGVTIDTLLANNQFILDKEFMVSGTADSDRILFETVKRYSNGTAWEIQEPQYHPNTLTPYLGIYKCQSSVSGTDYEIMRVAIFGFIDSNGTAKNISGTCISDIYVEYDSTTVPNSIDSRIDFKNSRSDCGFGNKKITIS